MRRSDCRACAMAEREPCVERLELQGDAAALVTPWSHPALDRTKMLNCSSLAALVASELAKLADQ